MTLITLSLAVFLTTTALLWLFFWWNDKDTDRLDERLQDLANPNAASTLERDGRRHRIANALPKLTKAFLPSGEKPRTRLQKRLRHAGYYHPEAITRFLAIKMLLLVVPWVPAVILALAGVVAWWPALGAAALFGLLALVGSGLWLNWKKNQRQITFRAALPDVLDVLVICLEGGASLPSALVRVTDELRLAHPELGLELAIIEREMQLGRSLGEAFMHFAERSDLEEVRSLAACMNQTDRLGGGLVKTLRLQGETMRERRLHYAEERAQKAGTKILFPTLLLIFPAIFVILIGPAAFQVHGLMQKTKQEALSGRNAGKK
jgi:tight adherence protein C